MEYNARKGTKHCYILAIKARGINMFDKSFFLYPYPKKLTINQGVCYLSSSCKILNSNNGGEMSYVIKDLYNFVHSKLPQDETISNNTCINFIKNEALGLESYIIDIQENGIFIEYSREIAAHYATVTLKQLISEQGNKLSCIHVEDEPDFSVRGVTIDIGRDKIPTMESLYKIVDLLSEVKINQLQLYMEGYCYKYKGYEVLFSDETPITAEEFQQLDKYAKEKFIDLVPNQNCFGHMTQWLSKEELKDLAENEHGFDIITGIHNAPGTLNPLDERSYNFVKGLLEDLIPNFTSDYMNINFDEPFELGTGKSSEMCKALGKGRVYLDFLLKIAEVVRNNGKKILMWGDIITAHPELLKDLPKDITVLDWNYEGSVSFEKHCKIFKENNVNYYVCPGTSSWCSISGRTDNMMANILNAAENGLKYGAKGMLITDWGDLGNWQYLPISYPGYVYGAAVSWNLKDNKEADVSLYINKYIFKDESNIMAQSLLKLGNYYKFEPLPIPNQTMLFFILARMGFCTKQDFIKKVQGFIQILANYIGKDIPMPSNINTDFKNFKGYIEGIRSSVLANKMQCADADIIQKEVLNTIALISHGVDLINYIICVSQEENSVQITFLENMYKELSEILDMYNKLWLLRNRRGGLNRSTKQFELLLNEYNSKINELS